jgi:excisionase family DNA binding protein
MVDWLTIGDLAAYLKKPKSSLYKLVLAKKLRGYKVGKSWRFDREEVDRWVKSQKAMTPKGARRSRRPR